MSTDNNNNNNNNNKSSAQMLKQAKPFVALILQQFGYAGMSIISKAALNQGMSQHVLVVYRHIIAAVITAPFAIVLERKTRPKMTFSIFFKIMLLAFLEPVLDQNLYYTGMKYTTATFATAMCNVLPAFAFIMAWICRLEKVNIKKVHSQAKIMGTIVAVGGAMFMTMYNGPVLNLPWAKQANHLHHSVNAANNQNSVKGALMIIAGCVCWSSFIILQAITLKSYPAELSLTSLMCLMGAGQGTFVALGMEWGNPAAWSLRSQSMILASLYSGVFRSGFAYYIQGLVMIQKGPVFVTAFNPVGLVIVAILSSFILSELMYLGRVIGAVIIVVGLYMVLWGKSKDKPPSEITEKDLPTTTTTTDEQIIVKIETTKTRNQELSVVATDDTTKKSGEEVV
ncbi:WAT1-related protein At2g39510 [Cannabis sativa]|uniref:WAT1-related protein At2g39510 n=1 Tax=Cannabis sativa TaxID=3483 RepID=UPI0029CA97A7|nr:WAT1-related protein At2g39510 [Cannabis sativa]